MATVPNAVAAGVLDLFEPPQWEPRGVLRPLWVTSGFMSWADETPNLHDTKRAIGRRTLFEHLEQMLTDFRCDERIRDSDIKRLMPTKDGLWKMYPPGLRVYGWCPQPNSFVAVTGALEADTKSDKQLNDLKRNEVTAFIKANRLENTLRRGDFLALFPHET